MSFRKLLTSIFFSSCLFLLFVSSSFAANGVSWSSTDGPSFIATGISVIDIEVDPTDGNRIWVLGKRGLICGIWRSYDGGETFEELPTAQDFPTENGAFVYNNFGSELSYDMLGLEYDPRNGRLYAFGGYGHPTYYGCIFVSGDEGVNWTQIWGGTYYSPLPATYTDRFAISPVNENYLFRGQLSASNQTVAGMHTRIFSMAKDGGINRDASWKNITSGYAPDDLPYRSGVMYISPHPTNESVVAVNMVYDNFGAYTPTAEAGIFLSTNEGDSFIRLFSDYPGTTGWSSGNVNKVDHIKNIEWDPRDSRKMRAIKSGANYWYQLLLKQFYVTPEVIVTTNEGKSWTTIEVEEMVIYDGEITTSFVPFTDPNDFDTIFLKRWSGGVWKTHDGGDDWEQPRDNLGDLIPARAIEYSSSEPGVIYENEQSFLLRRGDDYWGPLATWDDLSIPLKTQIKSNNVVDSPLSPGVIFGKAVNSAKSNDWGGTWGEAERFVSYAWDPINEGVCYGMLGASIINKTTDNWDSSSVIYTNTGTSEKYNLIAVHPTTTATLFASIRFGSDPRIEKSTDSGVNWAAWGPTGTLEAPMCMAINPVSPEVMYKGGHYIKSLAYGTIETHGVVGIKKSTDGGLSWTDITSGVFTEMLTVSAIAIDPIDPENVYVGTGSNWHKGKVYYSNDGGGTWGDFGLVPFATESFVKELVVNPNRPERVYALFWPTGNDPLSPGKIGRRVVGAPSEFNWINISSDLEDQWGNDLDVWGIDIDHKTDLIFYAATDRGVYLGIDTYSGSPPPIIDSLSRNFAFNLAPTPVTIYGNYFIDVDRAFVTIDGTTTEVTVQSYNPVSAVVTIPQGLALGTYEVGISTDPGGTGFLTSNLVTFEVKGFNPEGPQFGYVRFDGQTYLEELAPVPVSRAPEVAAEISDPQGIDENAFEYWMLRGSFVRHFTSSEVTFTYSGTSTEGTLSFNVDPVDPGYYDFVIQAVDKTGEENLWAGELEIEVGPVRVIGDVLSYPKIFKPLSAGETRIAYNLSRSAPTTVFIYDVSGQLVLTKKFASGSMGGRAGYNDFEWNGVSDIGGGYIGNGIYIIQVTSGNKEIGKGKLVVFD